MKLGDTRLPAAARTAAAVVCGLVLVCAPAARATRTAVPAPFGINSGILWHDDGIRGLVDPGPHADAIGRTPLRSVRSIAFWDGIEPTAPDPVTGTHRFVWTFPDGIVTALARNGVRWDPILGFSSPWAGSVKGTAYGLPPTEPFANYAAAVAARYGRGGAFWRKHPELPYVPVVSYQVWNEENLDSNWTPETYADFYLAVRRAIVAGDPHARVAVGAVAQTHQVGSSFLRRMFAARPALLTAVDAIGITVYGNSPQEILDDVVATRTTLDDLGARDTPIDVDETGWATSGGVLLTDLRSVSETTRAAYLAETVRLLAGSDCGIGSVSPYAWTTYRQVALDANDWFGLADRQTATLSPSGDALAGAVERAVTNPASTPVAGPCGRPDLPPLVRAPARHPGAVTVSQEHRCSTRRLHLRFTLGPDPEPAARMVVTSRGSKTRTLRDPDGPGPATTPTSVTVTLPKRPRRVTVTAYDDLDRARGHVSFRTPACRLPAHARRR